MVSRFLSHSGVSQISCPTGACLAAAAALAALAVPLKLPWLGVAGLVVAAVGAMASLVISTEQARLESKRERAELGRRVKVRVAPITEIDPTLIGVDPAATQTVLGGTVPEYVGREIDAELRGAIEAALSGAGSRMLVVVGASKVGKSRTLFEALSACSVAQRLQLVAPAHGDALRSLLPGSRWQPGQSMRCCGKELYDVVLAIMYGSDRHLAGPDGPPLLLRHTTCDHDTHGVVVCAHCGEPLHPHEVDPRPDPGATE
jgi:hypothetical protein